MKLIEEEIIKICSPTIYKHGIEYYKEGRVHLRVRKPDSIVAAVDDGEAYTVHIGINEGHITDYLCTCPYYRTMGCACKHIVAALKSRQNELEETENSGNQNDILASRFCSEFETIAPSSYRIAATIKISRAAGKLFHLVGLKLYNNSICYPVRSIEQFLNSLISGEEYKFSKNKTISYKNSHFDEASKNVLDILIEAYENKARTGGVLSSLSEEIEIGESSAKRLFPLLEHIESHYMIDAITYSDLRIVEDNPDILVDITATDKNINLSVTESGVALTSDGSFFFFENAIFKTTSQWQAWFMPIYRSMIAEHRTQLEFSGENSVKFASTVLPVLKKCHGVVCYGLEELVITETPKFEIYLDRNGNDITGAVKVIYGDVSLILPSQITNFQKIIVRDYKKENEVLLFFSDFEKIDNLFVLRDNENIFLFLTEVVPLLKDYAMVYMTDNFKSLADMKYPKMQSSVRYDDEIDLLELSVDSELSNAELMKIFKAYNSRQSFYRRKNGEFVDFGKSNPIFSLLAENIDFSKDEVKGSYKISKQHALYLSQLSEIGVVSADSHFMKMVDDALNSKAQIPDYLNIVLRDYQKIGVHWMHQLSMLGLGGILADDMGLGKTLQVIAFVMSEKKNLPSLVVVPSSLTYNWLDEISKFSPDARAKIIDGPKEERKISLENIDGFDFIITSYSLLRRDIPIYQDLKFSYCFLDEAQHIKNHKTVNAHAVKKINAERYYALTGTPIENSIMELWSIFDYALNGYLGKHKDFSARYDKKAVKTNSIIDDLREKTKPFILRRMKKDVLSELPEKIENTIYSDFEAEQKQIYSAFLKVAKKEISSISDVKENPMRILALLTRLRQICCDPKLINAEYKKESGKLTLLREIVISAIASEHRILIFSQFTSMLNIIKELLVESGIDCFYLDGSTSSARRLEMANAFNDGEKQVFLVSLKAGGTGLNLVGADMVIHYDPWWNPAVMDQASDRAYRIGQTKAVQVIKLVTRNSIEEQIMKLSEKKKNLADGIIHENKLLLSSMTKEELLSLFKDS